MNAEIYAAPDGWRFRVKGDNGEIVAVGEAYVRRIDAEHALHTLFDQDRKVDVTIRSHSGAVDDHYTFGVPVEYPELDEPVEEETDV